MVATTAVMKRPVTDPKRRRALLTRARRRARRTRISKFKRRYRIGDSSQSALAAATTNLAQDFSLWTSTVVDVPTNLSFANNVEEMLALRNRLHFAAARGSEIYLNLSDVSVMEPDGLAMLLAWINDPAITRHHLLRGNVPRSEELKIKLARSGFFDHVKTATKVPTSKHSRFFFRKRVRVAPSDADEAVQLAHSSGHRPSYAVIVEAMSNTWGHAATTRASIPWLLHVAVDPSRSVARFVFVDGGRGLFNGLRMKFGVDALKRAFGLTSNLDLVAPLLAGQLGSRTRQRHRGKGIPDIARSHREGEIQRLVMIANDVHMDFATHQHYLLAKEFRGTFLTWEIPATLVAHS